MVILAFPCNQFGAQEPGTVEEVCELTARKFKRSFPLQAKIDVSGPNALSVYATVLNPAGKIVSWNFHKFLVGKDGMVFNKGYPGKVSPLSMEGDIETLLRQ